MCVYIFFFWICWGWGILIKDVYLLYITIKGAIIFFFYLVISQWKQTWWWASIQWVIFISNKDGSPWKDNCILIDSNKMPKLLRTRWALSDLLFPECSAAVVCSTTTKCHCGLRSHPKSTTKRAAWNKWMEMNDDILNSPGFLCISFHFWH